MKKLMGLLASALFASSLVIAPASANSVDKKMSANSSCSKSCSDHKFVMPNPKNRSR
jgi:hypothetical protein